METDLYLRWQLYLVEYLLAKDQRASKADLELAGRFVTEAKAEWSKVQTCPAELF